MRLPLATLFTLSLTFGCGDDEPYPLVPVLPADPLATRRVEWNPRQTALGQVAAVAERGEEVVVLSDQGALFFSNGLLRDRDSAITSFRQAALLPAAGEPGDWLIGVDGNGRLRWLRGKGQLEDVSPRYGLSAPVEQLAAIGRGRIAFALSGALWLAEGPVMTRYEGAAPGLSGGAGRAVSVSAGTVRVFDQAGPAGGVGRSYALPGVLGAAIDAAGRLILCTATSIYIEEMGSLRRLHDEPGGTITGIIASGGTVWIAIGDGLAVLRGGRLLRSSAGLLSPGTRLLASPTGDLWLLRDGKLDRIAEEDGGGADEDLWKRAVLPIYTRSCSQCHQPGAAANIDLSTYGAWNTRRALIEQRVMEGKPTPMPPAGAVALIAEDLSNLRRWLTPSTN